MADDDFRRIDVDVTPYRMNIGVGDDALKTPSHVVDPVGRVQEEFISP